MSKCMLCKAMAAGLFRNDKYADFGFALNIYLAREKNN